MSALHASILVPTCGRPERLKALLERLEAELQTVESPLEVIVSDDAAQSDRPADRAPRRPGVRVLRGPGRGPAANRNHAARHAAGEWLIFVDDDCLPRPGWLLALLRQLSDDLDVVEGRIEAPEKRPSLFRRDVENLAGGCYWSANLAVRRAFFDRIGGFDEDFLEAGGEDMELAHRFATHGARTFFCAEAVVDHPSHVMTWRGVIEFAFRIRWLALYWVKTGRGLPAEAPLGLAACHTAAARLGLMIRTTARAVRAATPRTRAATASQLALDWALAPILLPYFVYWDLRFRLMLRQRLARCTSTSHV